MSASISGAASPSLPATGPYAPKPRASATGVASSASAGASIASADATNALADANPGNAGGAAAPPAKSRAAGDDAAFDITAESAPDSAAALSAAVIKRAEMYMLAQHLRNQDQQARLDRMRAEFDNAQARRAEMLRESNALREMALEQMKHDDEVLKKFISWI